jgi:hypothetical protein
MNCSFDAHVYTYITMTGDAHVVIHINSFRDNFMLKRSYIDYQSVIFYNVYCVILILVRVSIII